MTTIAKLKAENKRMRAELKAASKNRSAMMKIIRQIETKLDRIEPAL
jgi:uncharacterized small protein (DUF1192 family)